MGRGTLSAILCPLNHHPLFPFFSYSCALFSTLLYFFAITKNSIPLFSIAFALFYKKRGGLLCTFGNLNKFVARQKLVLRPPLRVKKAIRDARHLHHLGNIVHADDVRPVQDARRNRCGGTPDALFRWSRFPVPCQCCPEESFARGTHQERIAELCQLRQLLQHFVILREALAEPDARVKDDLRFCNPGFARRLHGLTQPSHDIFHDVPRKSSLLHGSRLPAHMHQDERHAAARANLGDARVSLQSGNIIDDLRAGVECGLRDVRFLRVDGNWNLQRPTKSTQHRQHAGQLFFGGNACSTRTCGFSADIQQIRTCAFHGHRLLDGAVRVKKLSAIRKAVRRDIQHPHHKRALAQDKCSGIEFEAKESASFHCRKKSNASLEEKG